MNAVVVEVDHRVPIVGVGYGPSAVLGLSNSVTDRVDTHQVSSPARPRLVTSVSVSPRYGRPLAAHIYPAAALREKRANCGPENSGSRTAGTLLTWGSPLQ